MSEMRIKYITIEAADMGMENPLPPIQFGKDIHSIKAGSGIPGEMVKNMAYGHVPNIMPYSLQDGYSRSRKNREFRVAILENENLKATFLLEFGGRLWSLYHKGAQKELLSVNPVFQPANLALRNAWFSGGIEWNIGTIGHSPFTCSPLFATRLEMEDGTPVLRMYEWERIRKTPFQIDCYLPDGSKVLFVRVKITNPNNQPTPIYWWSNIAVPETEKTRVVVPADSAFRFMYEEDGLELISTPSEKGTDYSYPVNINHSADYFFDIPEGSFPWISVVDGDGKGLFQTSTKKLGGRKLFLWGMGNGGRKWQEFLSQPGEAYIEIQAGLARTQMEHLEMPAGAEWSWLEAYGLVDVDPKVIHGENWDLAKTSIEEGISQQISELKLDEDLEKGKFLEAAIPIQMIQTGSGWGALENLRRLSFGLEPISAKGLCFDSSSLTSDQAPWVDLLNVGHMKEADPYSNPGSVMIQDEWLELLSESLADQRNRNWFSFYQSGIMKYYKKDIEGARVDWEKSLSYAKNVWALRNLGVLAQDAGETQLAEDIYLEAISLKPDSVPLAIECGKVLIANNHCEKWLGALDDLPEMLRNHGRIRLLEAQASLMVKDFDTVLKFFDDQVVIPDLREGEESLSELWIKFQIMRSGKAPEDGSDEAQRRQILKMHPIPDYLDFRMKAQVFESYE